MDKTEQQEFVDTLLSTFKDNLIHKLPRVPDTWEGKELRQWVVDSAQAYIVWTKMTPAEKRKYNNDLKVKCL